MQADSIRNLRTELVVNHKLCFRMNLVTSILLLVGIPWVRGIRNLNALYSAQCLQDLVIIIGILVLVSLCAPENIAEIRDVTKTRVRPYAKTLGLRIIEGGVVLFLEIAVFLGIMVIENSVFPFADYLCETFLLAYLLGITGLVFSNITRQVIIGYLISFASYLYIRNPNCMFWIGKMGLKDAIILVMLNACITTALLWANRKA